MFNYNNAIQFIRANASTLFVLFAIIALIVTPDIAHASGTETGSGDLPFEAPLTKLVSSIKGPVAFAISLIGIIAAGAVLIFGGEMSGFLRTMVFLVLVIAIIINATGIITLVSTEGAMIASDVGAKYQVVLSASQGIG